MSIGKSGSIKFEFQTTLVLWCSSLDKYILCLWNTTLCQKYDFMLEFWTCFCQGAVVGWILFCYFKISLEFLVFFQNLTSLLLLLIKHTGTAKPSGSSTGVNGVILAEAPTGWAPLNRPPSEEVAMDSAETEGILITFFHFILFCLELSIESYSNLIDNYVFYTPAF